MESKWKSIKFAFIESTLLRGLLWGGLLSLGVFLFASVYVNFLSGSIPGEFLYYSCSIVFVWGILFGFFLRKESGAVEGTNNILKKVLVHVTGWPLFFVAIYLCVMKGGSIAWDCVRFISSLANIDEYKQTQIYWILVIVSHTVTRFVLSFFIAYFFSMFLFSERKNKVIFSLIISLFCALFVLWFVINIAIHK